MRLKIDGLLAVLGCEGRADIQVQNEISAPPL
jgi:hypothetical protein